ncbi:Biopterin transporter [Gracilaria domingensis]|nr:Biopterin transporter [Gracilaria domingensis]
MSDTVPLFGFHKRSYIVLVSIAGTAAFSILGAVQLTHVLAPIAAFLLLLGNMQLATVDLLCEGKYAEMMVSKPESGSDLVSYVWGLYNIGSFFGSLIAGPMADHFNPRFIWLVCVPFAVQVIFPVLAGWLPEERLPPEERHLRTDKIRKHPDLFKLSVAMTLGSIAVGVSALLGSGYVQSVASSTTSLVLCVLGLKWLPRMLGRANLYMFLSSLLYVSLPGALDYWFTGSEECVPGGPHFSFTYYVTYASLVGSVAGAIGVAAFQRFLSRGSFRTAFWTTCLVKLAASAFDIAIVKRYNISLGIPDKMAFLLGDAIILQVAATLDFMPAVVLTSKVCPKGMEASVYALLASYQNLGSNVSRTLGVALIDWLEIKTTPPCDFTNLPMAIVIAHVLLPLLVFPLVFVLIPNVKMTDDLIEQVDEEGGSQFVRVPSEEDMDELAPEDKESTKASLMTKTPSIPIQQSEAKASAISVEADPAQDKDDPLASSDGTSLASITPGTYQQAETPSSSQMLEFPYSYVDDGGDEDVHERRQER